MNKRKLLISLGGLLILVGGIALSTVLSSSEVSVQEENGASTETLVRTKEVSNDDITISISITGRVIPEESVELFAEVQGISKYGKTPFKVGNGFRRGEVLLSLDSKEQRSSLASLKSTFQSDLAKVLPDLKMDYSEHYEAWKSYLLKMNVDKTITSLPEVKSEQLKLFLTGRGIYSKYYSIKEAETRLSKFIIKAPFTGTLTEASLNQGALVRVGQKLGELTNHNSFEIEGSVLNSELKHLKVGDGIQFRDVDTDNEYEGRLVRINQMIDPATQLVTVYFKLSGEGLRSGQYLQGSIPSYTAKDAVELPIQALVNDQFVFIVEDGKATKQSVGLVQVGADKFIATGLSDGTMVIVDQKNSAFEGSSVIQL